MAKNIPKLLWPEESPGLLKSRSVPWGDVTDTGHLFFRFLPKGACQIRIFKGPHVSGTSVCKSTATASTIVSFTFI